MHRLILIAGGLALAASVALVATLYARSSAKLKAEAPWESALPRAAQDGARQARGRSAGASGMRPSTNRIEIDDEGEEEESTTLGALKHLPVARAQHTADVASLFVNESDPFVRCGLAAQLGEIEDSSAVRKLLELLESEEDAEVRQALLQALSQAAHREELAEEIARVLSKLFRNAQELDERTQIEDVLGEIASPASAEFLRAVYADQNADPLERLGAAENLMRLRTQDPSLVPAGEAEQINARLRLEAQAADEPQVRCQALMALGERRAENMEFFRQMLADETDANVRLLLIKLTN